MENVLQVCLCGMEAKVCIHHLSFSADGGWPPGVSTPPLLSYVNAKRESLEEESGEGWQILGIEHG